MWAIASSQIQIYLASPFEVADLHPLVYESLLVDLAENPPHGLHEFQVQGFVVILEVDPASCPLHCLLPFMGVSAQRMTSCQRLALAP